MFSILADIHTLDDVDLCAGEPVFDFLSTLQGET